MLKNNQIYWAVVAQAFNPNIREGEAGRSLIVQGQPGLQSKCQDYTGKPSFENQSINQSINQSMEERKKKGRKKEAKKR